jgi:hypothetical protein
VATTATRAADGGDDHLDGGTGQDTLTGDAIGDSARVGHDVLDGGPGIDTIDHDWYRFDGSGGAQDPAPTVSFDGVANDGRPGERDDVIGIERIESGVPAGLTPTTLIGDGGANTFDLLFTNGVVRAGGGDDTITGSDYADALDGGAGNDHVSGGFGNDTITGGPGADDIGGDRTAGCYYGPIFGGCTIGSGNDTVYAQDGERDAVDCGPGADIAWVDAVDVTTGCETPHVEGGPSGGQTPSTVLAKPKLAVGRQHLRKIAKKRAIRLRCRLAQPGRCSIRASIRAKDARRLHLKVKRHARSFTLGKGTVKLKRAGTATVIVRIRRATARRLRHTRSLRVTFTATARYATGARTLKRRVRLRQ